MLLLLACFRLVRLIGWDEISGPLRARLLGVTDEEYDEWASHHASAYLAEGTKPPSRLMLAKLAHCPWCLGIWISAAVWLAWLAFPDGTVGVSVPLALSAGVGLIAKNGDP